MRSRLTISDVARELRAIFPYITDDMLREDIESGLLPTYPRHKATAWYWVDPVRLPVYIRLKTTGIASNSEVEAILDRLKSRSVQTRLSIPA